MTRIRPATASDNERLLAFQTRYAMLGGMPLRFDRSPDYFALHRCHSNDYRTWLAEDSAGHVKGMASMVVRDGYLAGEKQRIAYLGDLRIAPDRELARSWVDYVVDRLADLARHEDVQHTYCCVIRDNRIAAQSLFRAGKRTRLGFRHWRGYSNVSIYARRIAARRADSVRITNASSSDADALRAFLDQESRSQPFGCVFTADEFARRLNAWPDFGIERFLVARNAQGRIVGCVAPWDAGRIKRIVLERLPRSLGALRHGVNAIAPLLGRPPIAAPGQPLQDIYLTHLHVSGRDPDIAQALLDAVWQRERSRYALLQLCLYDHDPLWSALRGYRYTALPMDLYTLSTPGATALDPGGTEAIPGFEIYLV
ncbi:hypothetical protein FOZ70_07030 [Burkholderia sp. COPS]|uniref:hypothetical protein n=1 Tax=Burkholderia sp. COPS TaxID=2597663 RepID=UPI001CA52607|nr:hypothetical protein [Burkholderia sp. COPS]MBW5804503.1 hypothetical protein [Burkholderia sp. COPS]